MYEKSPSKRPAAYVANSLWFVADGLIENTSNSASARLMPTDASERKHLVYAAVLSQSDLRDSKMGWIVSLTYPLLVHGQPYADVAGDAESDARNAPPDVIRLRTPSLFVAQLSHTEPN